MVLLLALLFCRLQATSWQWALQPFYDQEKEEWKKINNIQCSSASLSADRRVLAVGSGTVGIYELEGNQHEQRWMEIASYTGSNLKAQFGLSVSLSVSLSSDGTVLVGSQAMQAAPVRVLGIGQRPTRHSGRTIPRAEGGYGGPGGVVSVKASWRD